MSSMRQIIWKICNFFMSLFFGLATYVQASSTLNKTGVWIPQTEDPLKSWVFSLPPTSIVLRWLVTSRLLIQWLICFDCIAGVYIHLIGLLSRQINDPDAGLWMVGYFNVAMYIYFSVIIVLLLLLLLFNLLISSLPSLCLGWLCRSSVPDLNC